MQVHLIITLAAVGLEETRPTTFDLDATARLLLNMLDVGAPLTDDLSSKVETWDRLEVDWNPLFWPFALRTCQL